MPDDLLPPERNPKGQFLRGNPASLEGAREKTMWKQRPAGAAPLFGPGNEHAYTADNPSPTAYSEGNAGAHAFKPGPDERRLAGGNWAKAAVEAQRLAEPHVAKIMARMARNATGCLDPGEKPMTQVELNAGQEVVSRYAGKPKSNVELTGRDGGPVESVNIHTNDPVEAARLYQEMMRDN